ncbi:MAG TPA: nitroreductase family protein [Syntrophales bacterium]|nr:nitroreductase family protein [Syntrophales bacterium]
MTIIQAIERRISCRTYRPVPLEPEKIERLAEALLANTTGPFGSRIRFALIRSERLGRTELRPPGTYGVIKGARDFIAGALPDTPRAMEDYGYCMEKNILAATALGLGTCWLGGTFHRTGFAGRMNLAAGELVPAVSPVGYASGQRSLRERAMRFSAGSDRRKPWGDLFYEGDVAAQLAKDAAGDYATPLECVRIAPSAANKQPWRIIRDRGAYHFYLKRTPGYDRIFAPIRIQNIDMGIAMCHFELSARVLGLDGGWTTEGPGRPCGDFEYRASWIARP